LATAATPPLSVASSSAATATQDGAHGDPTARDREPGSGSSDAGSPRSEAGLPGNGAIAQHLGAAPADAGAAMQAALWGGGSDVRDAPQAGSGPVEGSSEGRRSVFERRTPARSSDTPQRSTASDEDDDGASLEATELANRLRGALAPLGFKLEPLALGQLTVHADMGRRSYRVLVQLLCRSKRLDWADLLARRRTSGVRYLAVVGDHRDLIRLTNPADLARATLWSWQALDRMIVLHRSVPLSPVELEAHFERDGLFEHGLKRLEDTVAQRVGERGAMSEVLARLAVTRSPSVFLLEELAGE